MLLLTAPAVICPPDTLVWRVHLLRRRPERLWPLLLCGIGTLALGLLMFRNPLLALLPPLLLALSVGDFLLPVTYTLSETGVSARRVFSHLEMDWNAVRHVYAADGGLKLSPLERANSRWEPLRGILLRFADGNDAEVTDAVRRLREKRHAA